MTKIIVQNITAHGSAVDFKDIVSANHAKQWLDSGGIVKANKNSICLLYTSPSPRDYAASRMPSSA